jgi:hypothetical protein
MYASLKEYIARKQTALFKTLKIGVGYKYSPGTDVIGE